MADPRQVSGWYAPPPDWLDGAEEKERSLEGWFLALVFLLGALLRFYALTGQSLWVDELATWNQVRPGGGLTFLQQIRDGIQGPLYMAAVWPLVRWQDPALMMRLPAALAGAAAVPLLGSWAARVCDRRTGKLTALFLAINPFHIWYSQEARGYSFLVLFAILAAHAFTTLREGRPRWRDAVGLGLCCAAAMASNLSALFLWGALGLSWLVFVRGPDRGGRTVWLAGFGLGLVLAAPWLLQAAGIWAVDRLVPGGQTGEALRGETTFTWLALPYTAYSFFFGFSLGPSLADLHTLGGREILRGWWPWYLAGAVCAGIACLAGVRALRRERGTLLLWIAVPVLCLVLLAVRNVKPWNPRYAAVSFPWVVVLAAAGLARLRPRPRALLGVLLAGLTLWSLGGYYWNGRYAKEDVRGAAQFLTAANLAADPVVVPVVTAVFQFYYRGQGDLVDTYREPALVSRGDAEAFVGARLAGHSRCWLVWARSWYFDPQGHLPAVLAAQGRLRLVHEGPGVKVFSWERHEAG